MIFCIIIDVLVIDVIEANEKQNLNYGFYHFFEAAVLIIFFFFLSSEKSKEEKKYD